MWLLESLIDTLATLQHSQICRPQRHTNRQIVIQPLFSCGESTRSAVSCYDSFKPRYLSFTDSRDMCQVSLSALHFFIIKLAIVHPWGIFWYYQNMIKGNRCNDIHNWVREIAQEFFSRRPTPVYRCNNMDLLLFPLNKESALLCDILALACKNIHPCSDP